MAIVDPFDAPASGGIVDPFDNQGKKKTDEAPKKSEREPAPPWSQVPIEAAKHFLPNAWDVAKGVGGAALQSAENYAPYGPFALPKAMFDAARSLVADPTKIPRAVWSDLAEKYGGEENLRRSLATRPAEVALDLASLAAPIEGVAAKAGEIGQIARAADVSKPFYEGLPKGPPPSAPPPIPRELSPVQEALQRRREAGQQVDIPRAVTDPRQTVRAGGQALSVMPIVGTPLREAVQAVPAQVGGHIEDIASQFGPKLPENVVGGGIEQTLSRAAQEEAAARQAQVEAANQAAQQRFEAEQQAREQAIRDRQAQANAAARRTFGSVNPIEMAEDTINDVQNSHAQDEMRNQQAWRAVNELDAHTKKSAFETLHDTVDQGIKDAGVTLDPVRTPNAWSMMQEAKRLSAKPGQLPPNVPPRLMSALEREYGVGQVPPKVLEDLGFPGGTAGQDPQFRLLGEHAPAPDATTVPVQGMEELRKRFGDMAFDAVSPTDRRASNAIKNAFGDWYGDALENNLAPGSATNARDVIDNAITSHRNFRTRFGYNQKALAGEHKTAAKILNQMATGDIGPEDVARHIIGSKPGGRGTSAPLYDAIMGAVDNPAQVRGNIRGAYWNALTEGRTPDAISSGVAGLRPTRMGRNLFEPHEHDLMGGYAELAQRTPDEIAALRKEKPPTPTKATPGETEQLAGRVLGRNRSDEAILGKFDSAIRQGGDIKEAARMWGKMSDTNRNEVRGSWLRNMGGGGEQFNVSAFIKNWSDYSDQAKAFMLGREDRAAMNDFHTALKDYSDTIRKYGNPSGTAQVSAWHKLATGALKAGAAIATGSAAAFHPIGIAVAGLGLRRLATVLAKPAGAQQINRWSRLATAYNRAPSRNTLNLLQAATRSLDTQSQ